MPDINTVILIDLENLTAGYGRSQPGAGVSLRRVVDALRALDAVRGVAILRAYANWSDPRLGAFRHDVTELGIEPVQVFGLGRDGAKNVADIQLAVDAIDLAHVRPTLDTYVIVSGDGGFAALAKKLREYGKVVIGAAYRESASQVLAGLCDHFVKIEASPAVNGAAKAAGPGRAANGAPATLGPEWSRDEGLEAVRSLLGWYATKKRSELLIGMHMTAPREACAALLPGFTPKRFAFPKFTDFLAHACEGTPLMLSKINGGVVVLTFRDRPVGGVTVASTSAPMVLHSEEHYRAILAKNTPLLPIPSADVLEAVMAWLVLERPQDETLTYLIDRAVYDLDREGDEAGVKGALLSLTTAGVFDRAPEGVRLSLQRLTLRAECQSEPELRSALFRAVLDKLEGDLESVDLWTVREILGG